MKQTERSFNRCRWTSLMMFSVMYSFVYLGRFNINNLMDYIVDDVILTDAQQRMISMSVFVSYALGSFINGYLADRFGAKRVVLVGGVMTCLLNMSISVQHEWSSMLLTWFFNGYFQSMIWVGGISLLSHWWPEGERGKGVGIANFFSGMSHTIAYLIPIMMFSLWPTLGWRMNFIVPMGIMLVLVILFGVFAVERPENVGLPPYESKLERHREREAVLSELYETRNAPWAYFFSQPKFIWWCGIAMLSSICRYGLLNWIPLYFGSDGGGSILSETFSNLMLPVGMAFGTLSITWVAGTKMFDNKGVIVMAMAAICGTLVIVFPMIDDTQAVLVGIFFTGFVLYGINGILWVHAIDQGCRVFAGSVAGIFNGFAYLGACLESVLFPVVLNVFHTYLSVFVVMEILCLLMVMCGMMVAKKNTVVEPEVKE